MSRLLSSLRVPALLGFLTTLPFMVMEFVNRRGYGEPFPWSLFFILWFLAAGLTFALLPIIRDIRAGENPLRKPVLLALRVAVLIALAFIWIQAVVDQMPCFRGVLLCD
jgi:hypothetical protein